MVINDIRLESKSGGKSGDFKRGEKNEILDEKSSDKPQITYPTSWGFKIIGRDKEELHSIIKEVMQERRALCSYGNPSKNGKFHSYNASCTVRQRGA